MRERPRAACTDAARMDAARMLAALGLAVSAAVTRLLCHHGKAAWIAW